MNEEEESTNKVLRINFKKRRIEILCEWVDCNYSCSEIRVLQEHLINHLRTLCNQIECNNAIQCGICLSILETDFSSLRHMYYHAYHFYLKSRGKYIMGIYKLNECNLDNESANIIPCLLQPFICQWDKCNYSSDNISDFYDHIEFHPSAEVTDDNEDPRCKWSNCNFVTKTIHRLQGHLGLHGEKRYIACPTCGLCFSTTSKFTDHLKRQLVGVWNKQMQDKEMADVLSTLASTCNPVIPLPKRIIEPPPEAFKCNLCMHLFATKRLLKEHEARHIQTVSCPHCNHTCASRYALKRHILFRHTEEKPFKCTECDMGFKCNDGLKRHSLSIHGDKSSREKVHCDVSQCPYIAANRRSLNIHKSRIHCKVQTLVTKVYVCHKCDQEYVIGHHLTEHLSKEHGINKTSNRYRHQYKICEDGKYRLNMFDLQLKTALNERHKQQLLSTDIVENDINGDEMLAIKKSMSDNGNENDMDDEFRGVGGEYNDEYDDDNMYNGNMLFPMMKMESIEVVDVFD